MQPATPPPQPHLNPPSLPEGPHLNKNARNKFEYVWHSYLVAYGDQQNCLLSVGILFFFFFHVYKSRLMLMGFKLCVNIITTCQHTEM